MKKFALAALGGSLVGVLIATQFAAPLAAQETNTKSTVYQQLNLFGDINMSMIGCDGLSHTTARSTLLRLVYKNSGMEL